MTMDIPRVEKAMAEMSIDKDYSYPGLPTASRTSEPSVNEFFPTFGPRNVQKKGTAIPSSLKTVQKITPRKVALRSKPTSSAQAQKESDNEDNGTQVEPSLYPLKGSGKTIEKILGSAFKGGVRILRVRLSGVLFAKNVLARDAFDLFPDMVTKFIKESQSLPPFQTAFPTKHRAGTNRLGRPVPPYHIAFPDDPSERRC